MVLYVLLGCCVSYKCSPESVRIDDEDKAGSMMIPRSWNFDPYASLLWQLLHAGGKSRAAVSC